VLYSIYLMFSWQTFPSYLNSIFHNKFYVCLLIICEIPFSVYNMQVSDRSSIFVRGIFPFSFSHSFPPFPCLPFPFSSPPPPSSIQLDGLGECCVSSLGFAQRVWALRYLVHFRVKSGLLGSAFMPLDYRCHCSTVRSLQDKTQWFIWTREPWPLTA